MAEIMLHMDNDSSEHPLSRNPLNYVYIIVLVSEDRDETSLLFT